MLNKSNLMNVFVFKNGVNGNLYQLNIHKKINKKKLHVNKQEADFHLFIWAAALKW